MGFRIWGLGFRTGGLGLRILEFRVGVWGLVVWYLGFGGQLFGDFVLTGSCKLFSGIVRECDGLKASGLRV